jgi:hypothetical protein
MFVARFGILDWTIIYLGLTGYVAAFVTVQSALGMWWKLALKQARVGIGFRVNLGSIGRGKVSWGPIPVSGYTEFFDEDDIQQGKWSGSTLATLPWWKGVIVRLSGPMVAGLVGGIVYFTATGPAAYLLGVFGLISQCALNLLPIPPFIGGHLMLLCVQGIRGRPVGERTRLGLTMFGLLVAIIVSLGLYYILIVDPNRLLPPFHSFE